MKRIYISGPMSGLPNLNFPTFKAEATRLRALGYDVVNPAELHGDTPNQDIPWEECLRTDLIAMLGCDTVAMLPAWHQSKGTHLELHVAHRVGIKIVESAAITFPWAPSPDELAATARLAGC